jgi:hypothetical protein
MTNPFNLVASGATLSDQLRRKSRSRRDAITSAALTGPGGGRCLRGLAIALPRHNLPRPQRACPALEPRSAFARRHAASGRRS